MSSGDETRVMEVPAELRHLMMGPTPSPDAETPCVGVPSVGDTHFGETQVAFRAHGATAGSGLENSASDGMNSRAQAETTAGEKTSLQSSPLKLLRAPRGRRVSKPVALGIGLGVGIGAALFTGLLQSRPERARQDVVPSVTVETLVRTEDGAGIPEVPVRVGNQVSLTDESGRAPFLPLSLDGPLTVTAECPSGYAGGRLAREIPKAVASSSEVWTFHLVCRPEFADVSLSIETEGCGEMRIWMDGTPFGTTSGGTLKLSRRIHAAEVVEVKAEPLRGACEFESVRHVSLSPEASTSAILFKGKRPRSSSRGRKTTSLPVRPYRL